MKSAGKRGSGGKGGREAEVGRRGAGCKRHAAREEMGDVGELVPSLLSFNDVGTTSSTAWR